MIMDPRSLKLSEASTHELVNRLEDAKTLLNDANDELDHAQKNYAYCEEVLGHIRSELMSRIKR